MILGVVWASAARLAVSGDQLDEHAGQQVVALDLEGDVGDGGVADLGVDGGAQVADDDLFTDEHQAPQ